MKVRGHKRSRGLNSKTEPKEVMIAELLQLNEFLLEFAPSGHSTLNLGTISKKDKRSHSPSVGS